MAEVEVGRVTNVFLAVRGTNDTERRIEHDGSRIAEFFTLENSGTVQGRLLSRSSNAMVVYGLKPSDYFAGALPPNR
jgi:hypothetical protein